MIAAYKGIQPAIHESAFIAVVLNGALVKKGSVVAAGSVVREGQVVGPYQMVAGSPATVKKERRDLSLPKLVARQPL